MTKRVFMSCSSPDVAKADLIREALEDHDISCWIAPRDLSAGTQWGAGIVQAIQGCEAVVVVFSDAANRSPQMARDGTGRFKPKAVGAHPRGRCHAYRRHAVFPGRFALVQCLCDAD
jgi:hypothetical protein